MIQEIELGINWLASDKGTAPERASFGELTLRIGDTIVTEVIDLIAQTPRSSIRVSLNHLGHWFADNWWRLRWEPVPPTTESSSWRMAHEMGAAGGGFVWPPLQFSSDGETVQIAARPTRSEHTVRYIRLYELVRNGLVCSADDFARAIDRFMDTLHSRQEHFAAVDQELWDTWLAVCGERVDPDVARFRKREALLGLNPGEEDPEGLASLFGKNAWMGNSALDELFAALNGQNPAPVMDELRSLRKRDLPRLSFERVLEAARDWSAGTAQEPGEKGDRFAQHLRKTWGLGTSPISDEFLNDLLGADIQSDELGVRSTAPAVAFRDDGHIRPALRPTRYPTNRRFEVARLIGDSSCMAYSKDAVQALTDARTARQKFQRAAAQELLCPVEGLKERVTLPRPSDEELSTAADHFNVSLRVVTHTLVNKKLVSRDYLDAC